MNLPPHQVFVVKFGNSVHRDLITRSIVDAGGQASGVDSYGAAVSDIRKWVPGQDLAGVVYAAVHEEAIPGQEGLAKPEEVIAHLRGLVGDAPILATYGSDKPVENGTELERRLLENGADFALSHPFDLRDFYAALGTAMRQRPGD